MNWPNHSNNGNGRGDDEGTSSWLGWRTVLAGAAAVAGGLYYLGTSAKAAEPEPSREKKKITSKTSNNIPRQRLSHGMSAWTGLMEGLLYTPEKAVTVPESSVPIFPNTSNLNALLDDIYLRYVALKTEDFTQHYNVFEAIFKDLQDKMKEVDRYYKKYSSRKQFAGSHFDGLRIKKPDEFDMDIVVGLPVNFKVDPRDPGNSDIVLEHKSAGYIQMRMGTQYKNLPRRDPGDWENNKQAYEWQDEQGYLLHTKFATWFQSVVQRALNKFPDGFNGRKCFYVDGVAYSIKIITKPTSPAVTFYVENHQLGFKLDIDFVPALKFPESRWPICRGYREIPPGCNREDWMVVPKLNRAAQNGFDGKRSWRVALHDQEKRLMHNTHNLRQAVRLLKKLRDAQGMKEIASYFIKTLFFHEILERKIDPYFWNNNPAKLFKIMVQKLHDAMAAGSIPYFWHSQHNLIGHVSVNVLEGYKRKLAELLKILEQSDNCEMVAKYLLTNDEFSFYKPYFESRRQSKF